MALWLCLRFDALPLEALLTPQCLHGDMALVVSSQRRVLGCNECAQLAGVIPGQSISTAQALLAQQKSRFWERSPEAENTLLQQLLSWAYGISPHLQQWQDNALMIEVGSCLRLHHGLNQLLKRVDAEIGLRGLTVAKGVAETRTAAWLLSHADSHSSCQAELPLEERIAPLPLKLLTTEFPQVVARLEKAGITQFLHLLRISPPELGKRCGALFVDWLDRLMGRQQEPVIVYKPPQYFKDSLWFGFDIHNRQELHPAMERLLGHFCTFLKNTQLTCGMIEWRYLQRRGPGESLKVFSETAQQHAQRWLELSCLQLDNQTLPNDVEGLSLIVDQLQENTPPSTDLFHADICRTSRHELADRLRSRLGLKAVGYIDYRNEHLPEEAVVQAHSLIPTHDREITSLGQRPFWLFPEPHPIHQTAEQLYWNGTLEILHGPERIEDHWWSTPVSRDYYIACTPQKQPVWIYQDRHNRCWYLHGLFA